MKESMNASILAGYHGFSRGWLVFGQHYPWPTVDSLAHFLILIPLETECARKHIKKKHNLQHMAFQSSVDPT
jgi:hypothetical protein